jgi:hypothetical protein
MRVPHGLAYYGVKILYAVGKIMIDQLYVVEKYKAECNISKYRWADSNP